MTPTGPGQFKFRDAIGGPFQVLEVREVRGELMALFPAVDDEPAAALPVDDMSGDWEPAS
jgi:hypothetical protein